jgi:hypothetical protein
MQSLLLFPKKLKAIQAYFEEKEIADTMKSLLMFRSTLNCLWKRKLLQLHKAMETIASNTLCKTMAS